MHQDSSQKHYWENVKINDHNYRLYILKIIVLLRNYYAALNPKNLEIISNFLG